MVVSRSGASAITCKETEDSARYVEGNWETDLEVTELEFLLSYGDNLRCPQFRIRSDMLRATITFVLAFATLATPGRCCCLGGAIGKVCSSNCKSECIACLRVCHHATDDCSPECRQVAGEQGSSNPSPCPCVCQHEHPTAIVSNQQADDTEVAGFRMASPAGWIVLLPPLNCVADRPSQVLLQHARLSRFANSGELLSALNILRC